MAKIVVLGTQRTQRISRNVFEFYFNMDGDIHGAYSYGAQNRGFVAGSQTGLTGGLVSSVAKATSAFSLTFYIVEEQRLERIRRSSNPTTQKVLPKFLIARYPQSTYSTIRPQLFHLISHYQTDRY